MKLVTNEEYSKLLDLSYRFKWLARDKNPNDTLKAYERKPLRWSEDRWGVPGSDRVELDGDLFSFVQWGGDPQYIPDLMESYSAEEKYEYLGEAYDRGYQAGYEDCSQANKIKTIKLKDEIAVAIPRKDLSIYTEYNKESKLVRIAVRGERVPYMSVYVGPQYRWLRTVDGYMPYCETGYKTEMKVDFEKIRGT